MLLSDVYRYNNGPSSKPKSVLQIQTGRCDWFFSAGSSKIKIWASSCNRINKLDFAVLNDEARILTFDNLAEENE